MRTVFHTTSSKEAKELEDFSPGAKPFIISNILDLPSGLYCQKETTDVLQLLFLGRIDPSKNLEWLIRMLKGLCHVDFILRIAGEGHNPYVKELKELTKGDPKFIWMGFIEGEEKYKLLCQSDVLMLPSHTENFGNVVFEALCQGTAVMTSSAVGAKDYLTNNDLGWVLELSEPLWAETISSISQSKNELKRIKRQAPELIKKDFDPSKLASQYIDLYHKVYLNEDV